MQFNYPVNAVKVKFSQMLRSEDFANQLCLLSEQIPIGGSQSRNHVSKWLMTVLSDDQSKTASPDEFPIITKKIRDEQLGETHNNYFRRSAFYMSVKVILQHSLMMQLGAKPGKFLYKIVMLKFLIKMCTFYKSIDCAAFDIDLLSQMIAKITRRIEKLVAIRPNDVTEETATFYDETIHEAKETIALIREKINHQIENIQVTDARSARLYPLTDLNFESDICHRMPTLREYLDERLEETPQNGSYSR